MTADVRLALPARSVDAPAAARRFVRAALARWQCRQPVEDVLIVTTELVSNAIEHTSDDSELRLVHDDGSLFIEVSYASPEPPRPVSKAEGGAARGRGLYLVQQIAARWGVRWTAVGKVIWAELADPRDGTRLGMRETVELA